MHLLPATSVSLDEGEVAIDLDQPPGEIVVLSFADSDLGALAAAHKQRGEGGLSLRLASLRRLRHPLSIDLYLEKTAAHARFVLVRCLGGLDYWRYGLERLFDLATARGIALAVIPGEDRPDPRLLDHSTVPPACCAALEAYFRAGGVENMARLLAGVEAWASGRREAPSPVDAPRGFAFDVSRGVVSVAEALAACDPARPLAHILVYRSAILSGDTAPVAALREALAARDVESIVLAVSSLKDAEAVGVVDEAIRLRRPDVVISTTAFSARESLPAGEGGFASAASKAGWGPGRDHPPSLGPHPTSFGFASEATLPSGEGCALPSLPTSLPGGEGGHGSDSDRGRVGPVGGDDRRPCPSPLGEGGPTPEAAGRMGVVEMAPIRQILHDPHPRPLPQGEGETVERFSNQEIADRSDRTTFVLDCADRPILQAIPVGTTREAWAASERGLSGADLAMQIALPEFDGRIVAGPLSFKAEAEPDPALAFARRIAAPDAASIAMIAERAAGLVRLARTPRHARRLALVLSDYPARAGRAGFAVGLDTPASAIAILEDLAANGYDARADLPAEALIPRLLDGPETLDVPLHEHRDTLAALPEARRADIVERWGAPEDDPAFREGAFRFPVIRAGQILVALQPDRGSDGDRKGAYHDPNLPPRHAYVAFYAALRMQVHAIVHLGTHGTLEWLPGKAVALSAECWPSLIVGGLPVVYPFIVDDPGEAAPAKRRIGAVTIGHQTPDVALSGLDEENAALKELVEEFSAAQVLDPRRAALVAKDIRARAEASGLAAACGVASDTPMDEALSRLDAHLCDLGEVAIRDGLHVFGRSGDAGSAAGERAGLLAALDARFVPPGPSGSPSRGRRDVLPTGRNLATLDPRAIPTPAATALGAKAAASVVRRHLQEHGDYPRRVVMDLWASPTLRTGGEDIAQALALMGAAPTRDAASTRVTGFEILPLPRLDRPRIDVTIRVSGAFRDTFPDQIALLDQAARTIAALDEADEWNALAAARRAGSAPARVYGPAPGDYGAAAASLALDGEWRAREDLGRAYLAQTAHAYGAAGAPSPDSGFSERVAGADAFVHVSDVAERDILDGDAAADSIGGFAAAAALLGAAPALYSLDTSRAEPKARLLAEDVDRLVRGRLSHPRYIAGMLRHGQRGAAELANGVDALYAFAATTDCVRDAHFEALHAAYIADEAVNARLRAANPQAEAAIRARLADALARGLWTSRSNSLAALLRGEDREAAE